MVTMDKVSKDLVAQNPASTCGEVSEDFRKALLGYGLTTAEIPTAAGSQVAAAILVWQVTPVSEIPALQDFLASGSAR